MKIHFHFPSPFTLCFGYHMDLGIPLSCEEMVKFSWFYTELPLSLVSFPLNMISSSLRTSLLSTTERCHSFWVFCFCFYLLVVVYHIYLVLPCLRSGIMYFTKPTLVSFNGGYYLEIKIWVLDMLLASRLSLLLCFHCF